MPLSGFQDLCDSIAELAGCGTPEVVADGPRARAAAMDLRGVTITAVCMPEACEAQAFLTAQLEAPLPSDDGAAGAWLSLLDANSVLPDLDSPRFARNPLTGDVVMLWPCPLQDMTPLSAYQRANHMADVVLHWQRHRAVHPELLAPGRGGTRGVLHDTDAALDAAWRFRELYMALCDVLGQPAQPGPPDAGAFSFSLEFAGVEVVMAHLPRLRPHAALVGVPLGPREPGEQAQAEALAMMEANFALAGQPHGAAFSRDPASGELLLRYAYPLDGACGHHCLAQMSSLAAFAREWVASLTLPKTATPHPVPVPA
ncbi:MAG: hypothetical protein AB7P37_17865 [Ramlibacter sp.]